MVGAAGGQPRGKEGVGSGNGGWGGEEGGDNRRSGGEQRAGTEGRGYNLEHITHYMDRV